MKTTRKLHLWIGMITSLFILLESITGLLLSEPWLIGASEKEGKGFPMHQSQAIAASSSADSAQSANPQAQVAAVDGQNGTAGEKSDFLREKENESGVMGFIRGLHEGKIAGAHLALIVDITAISMIILTITGITLSLRVLRAQRNSRKKALAQQQMLSS